MANRTFEDRPATREHVPVLVALMGPSGGGKTYSAMRLATGIKAAGGGDIYVIDTEARRALHYADTFDFRHIDFRAPFGPLDYLAAIEHCVEQGAGTVVIDSMSHEHEGPGGVLEMHDAELDRMCGQDYKKRQRMTMLGWAKPKGERRRLINTVTQLGVNVIMCFRAKRKLKLAPGKEPVDLGWMPIGGDEFVYEMTVSALLEPGCNGRPNWKPALEGERAMVKLPHQFQSILPGQQLTEDIGEQLARWASGGVKAAPVADGTIPSGEHRGKTLQEVPGQYLVDLSEKELPAAFRGLVEAEMDRRADKPEQESE